MKSPSLQALLVTLVAALISLGAMEIYRENVLRDDIANHVLSSKTFGIADIMAKHGVKPFLNGAADSGWDGQFYYAISNDLLAKTDVPMHVDAPAYRYQRIGLPLAAWVVSRLTFQDWVSPLTFYLTNVGIVLFATFFAARHFARSGAGAWWALLWAATVGVQLTLLNGLPDAAADAFLIGSLVFLVQGRRVAYLVCATLAALSREAYVLMPVVLGLVNLWDSRIAASWGGRASRAMSWALRQSWPVVIPVVVFIAWQAYVRLTFGRAPASYAGSIVGIPMESWFVFTRASLGGHHPLAPPGWPSIREAIGLIFFAVLLASVAWLAARALRRAPRAEVPTRAIATFFVAIVALYACFGDTVILSYTGYLKAASLLFIAVPFLWTAAPPIVRFGFAGAYVVANFFFASYLWADRIAQPIYDENTYLRTYDVKNAAPIACLKLPTAAVRLVGIEPLRPNTAAGTLINPDVIVFDVAFTNTSHERYEATTGPGSVNYGYLWLTEDGNTIVSVGKRSFVPEGLAPGETRTVPIMVDMPPKPGRYLLRLTPVQEGCGWFYKDADSKLDIAYTIR